MDKTNFVKDGGSKLPLGFRFQPTDEEIVFQYLARKTFCHPLPALVIPEISVFAFDPWELPGDSDQDRYFFSNKESSHHSNGNKTGRATCSGYWKATGSTKRIVSSKGAPIVGIRKSLVFYKAKHPRPVRTNWIMHEYCIALSGNTDTNIQHKRSSQGSLIRIGNWTLCHIFLKKRGCTAEIDHEYDNPRSYGFTAGNSSSDTDSSSASSSSPRCDSTILNVVNSSVSASCDESSSKISQHNV